VLNLAGLFPSQKAPSSHPASHQGIHLQNPYHSGEKFLFTSAFWRDAAERAVRTAAQTGLALVTATAGLGLDDIAWTDTLSITGLATLASLLTSVATSGVGPTGTPSVVTEIA
jgi:hypothetical protein